MCTSSFTLTVLFQDPFWIAVCERTSDSGYEVCKVTFGSEPKDYEVYDFMLRHFYALPFGKSAPAKDAPTTRINPKRLQRQVRQQTEATGLGTKAQQALKLQQEQHKLEHHQFSKQQKEQELQRQFQLKQDKRKQKHRGH